jgi:hypothetical protein
MACSGHVDREKGVFMKRIGFLLATATAFVLLLAIPAFAGEGSANPGRPGGPGVSGAGGTAFTGANVSASFLILAVLVVVGALALYASRRRRVTAS